MKKVITLLLSLVLTFTTLFNYAPFIVYADEEGTAIEETSQFSEVPESVESSEESSDTIDQEVEEVIDEIIPEPSDGLLEDGEEQSGNKPAPANVKISEDTASGDLLITCEDPIWLEYLQKGQVYDRSTTVNYGYLSLKNDKGNNYTLQNFEQDPDNSSLSEDRSQLTLFNDYIVRLGIVNGSYSVTFTVEGYDDLTLDSKLNITKGVKDAPDVNDVHIKSENGNIIIESENHSEWLQAVAKFTTHTREGNTRKNQTGGSIYISGGNAYASLSNYRMTIDGETEEESEEIKYIDGALVISEDVIFKYGLPSGTYSFYIDGYGYKRLEIGDVSLTTNVKDSLPNNINAYFDPQLGLFIECDEDKEWLAGIAASGADGYYHVEAETEDGSTYYGNNTEEYKLVDFDGDRVFISIKNLVNIMNIPTGNYSFVIRSSGYSLEYRINDEHKNDYHIDGIERFPGATVKQENGDILIESGDANFLKALTVESDALSDGAFKQVGARVLITDTSVVSGNAVRSKNANDPSMFINTRGVEKITYDETNGRAVIKGKYLKEKGFETGTYNVWLIASGYRYGKYSNLQINMDDIATIVPSDTSIKENQNGDLELFCSDPDWLRLLCQGHNEQTDTNYGEVDLYKGGEKVAFFVYGMEGIMFDRSGDTVTIPNDFIQLFHVPNGDYDVTVKVEGYNDFNSTIKITKGAEPVEYTITFNANGGKGTMGKQTMVSDINAPLNTNQFTKANYRFAGWSLNKTGPVEYEDGASFSQHFEKTGSVTLYAIWEPVLVEGISFTYNGVVSGSAQIASGKSLKVTAVVEPNDAANKKVEWFVKKATYYDENGYHVVTGDATKNIATVSNGTITAKKIPNITDVVVRASAIDGSGVYGDFRLMIFPAAEAVSIYHEGEDVSKKTIGVDPEETSEIFLYATTSPADASNRVTWTSSNTKLATVDESGTVKIIGNKGTVKITAKTTDGTNKSAVVTINVAKLVKDITVTGNAKVAAGKSTKLVAAVLPDDAANKKVDWTIERAEYTDENGDLKVVEMTAELKKIATVSNGTVSAKKVGYITDVTVSATSKDGSNVSGKMTVTIVPAVETVSIYHEGEDVSKKTVGIDPGMTRTMSLSATTLPEDASKDVLWTSSNTKLAAVDENGLVTIRDGVVKGTVKITAKATDGTNKNSVVTLNIAKLVTGITLSGPQEVAAGKSVKLVASVEPDNAANKKVDWTVEKVEYTDENGDHHMIDTAKELKSYATVSNGTVSAKKVGYITGVTVVATAKDGSDVSGEMTVTIVPAVETVSIYHEGEDVSKKTIGIDPDDTKMISLNATTFPADASKKVTWISSNTKLATVDENGLVTIQDGVAKGTVKITAKAADGTNKNTVVTVNIAKLVKGIVVTGNARVAATKSVKLTAAVTPDNAANKKVDWIIKKATVYDESAHVVTGNALKNIATVSNGTVSAKKTDKITDVVVRAVAKDGSEVYGEATIRIYPIATSVVLIDENNEELPVNAVIDLSDAGYTDYPLHAKVKPDLAMNSFAWKSSNTSIATVDKYGYVVFTGKSGSVKITATTADGSNKSASVTFKK